MKNEEKPNKDFNLTIWLVTQFALENYSKLRAKLRLQVKSMLDRFVTIAEEDMGVGRSLPRRLFRGDEYISRKLDRRDGSKES